MLGEIREQMQERDIDCLILTQESNFVYTFGEEISGYMFISQGRAELVCSRFYRYQTEEMHVDHAFGKNEYEKLLEEKSEKFVGDIRADETTGKLEETFDAEQTDLMKELRLTKSEEEVDKIREACDITSEAHEEIRDMLFDGIDEFEAVAAINAFYAEKGVEESFLEMGDQSLVQANCVKPHRGPEKREIEPDDLVIVDSGCVYEDYCSDVTRTYCEEPSEDQRKLFDDVKEIQDEMIEMIEPGREISEVGRKQIDKAEELGYEPEKHVLHISHGVGVSIHEDPRISHESEEEFQEGMVVTIEPGLYVPEIGGARMEDVVLVTEDGFEILSSAPREL
jgi:Xaa-Pro aminopeptidase